MKWSLKTKTLATRGDLSSSIVVSMLVKSTCGRSRGAVATTGHKGALGLLPSYWRQCLQALITCLISLAIPGHQKHSCNRERVWSWPWCPASQWHPFRVAVRCTLGTTNSKCHDTHKANSRRFWRREFAAISRWIRSNVISMVPFTHAAFFRRKKLHDKKGSRVKKSCDKKIALCVSWH